MLEIKSLDEQHNHETNKELFRNLWQQRKLGDEEKENIRQMLDMKANKKIIQSNIMQATGKVVLMKDIHNMKVTNNKQNDLTTLQKAVNELTKVHGAFVKLQTDSHFRCIIRRYRPLYVLLVYSTPVFVANSVDPDQTAILRAV